jgi:hypothetical protein
MSSNALVLGWNRAQTGREKISIELFGEFVAYVTGLQKEGKITSFEPVFMDPHGGDMNGFFLIKGDAQKLDAVVASDQWIAFATRGAIIMQGFGVVRGAVGDEIGKRMALFQKYIP